MSRLSGSWVGKEDCLKHSGDWQYWTRGARHCLGCLRDGVQEELGAKDAEIAALRAKVERLREALRFIAGQKDKAGNWAVESAKRTLSEEAKL